MKTKGTSRKGYIVKGNEIYYVYRNIDRQRRVEGLEKVEYKIKMHRKKKVKKVATIIAMIIGLALFICGFLYILSALLYPSPVVEKVEVQVDKLEMEIETIEKSIIETPTQYNSGTNYMTNMSKVVKKELVDTRTEEQISDGGDETVRTLEYVETRDTYEVMNLMSSTKSETMEVNGTQLTRLDLPDKYYSKIDFSSFQPYMSYYKVTNTASPAYAVCYSEMAYTDENGFRRYRTTEDQFTVDGQDDYVIALGTFYKKKGTAGSRYLVETTTGSYTAIAGDEKADKDTDQMNMFTDHNGVAAIIEWIVDERCLNKSISAKGTVTAGPVEAIQGEITGIYRID